MKKPDPNEPVIPLRELLEQRLDFERTVITQKFEMLDTALKLQAAEIERRLTVLNHAHEAAVQEQARVLPREMFAQFKSDYDKWRDTVNNSLTTMATRSTVWTSVIGFIFLVVNVALILWKR